jgi:predicted membrane channel-forming protein YqfA (hemolysin III family)
MTSSTTPHDELRAQALTRLKKRAEFRSHLVAYVLINGTLVALWFVISSGALFWPIFPILGWGIGLVFHALDTYQRPFTDERIAREMRRLDPDHVQDDQPLRR